MTLQFVKMNGAGNDFVVFDARPLLPGNGRALFARLEDKAFIRQVADRANPHTKGCDQVIAMEGGHEHVFMHIYNADGEEVGACGNASRCIGWRLMEEAGTDKVTIKTWAGTLDCVRAGDHLVTIDMGTPYLKHVDIPVTAGISLDPVPIEEGLLKNGMALGMGNPHVVFFVDNIDAVPLAEIGPKIEHRLDIFPSRVNVSVAQILSRDAIKLQVWERGAGLTRACGTAACATLVVAAQKGLTDRKAQVQLPGGTLTIDWRDDNHVWMTGPVETEFKGDLNA